jgi:hypothetical protein
MSDAQLACVAIAAAPVIVGALWALGDLVGHVAAHKPPPSPARVARLSVGFVPAVALYLVAGISEAATHYAGTAFLRLRDWMDA